MVGRQKQKRSRVKKRFASAEPNGSVASIRSYRFAHVQCRVMCEASQNLSSFTLRLNRAPDVLDHACKLIFTLKFCIQLPSLKEIEDSNLTTKTLYFFSLNE